MLRTYFKIAIRNMLRSKLSSFINIAGLSAGMVVSFFIGLWIVDECSFNSVHKNRDRITRVVATQTFNGQTGSYPTTAVPVEQELRTKFKSAIKRTSLTFSRKHVLSFGDKQLFRRATWAGPEFPEMLSLTMEKGGSKGFSDPSSVLLSDDAAHAMFGNEDPINKVVKLNNSEDLKVVGVYKSLPENSTFYNTDFILPWFNKANWWTTQTSEWSNHGSSLLVELEENVDAAELSDRISHITQEHGYTASNETLLLHPMSRWHLFGSFTNGVESGGRIQFVWLFGMVGIFVLLLACINFMNLSTARSERRAREVGIRKAIGSERKQLIVQFLIESIAMALIAMILALGIATVALPFFNQLADKNMVIPWASPILWAALLLFVLMTGVIAGSYPAFYLSSFRPLQVLKGLVQTRKNAATPRKVLVVVQFTVSVVMIISTIVVYRQVQYAWNRPTGFSRDGLITVEMASSDITKHYNELRNELIATGAVVDMAQSNSAPTEISTNNAGLSWEGKDPEADPLFGTIAVTHDYGKSIGWKIVEGRDFSRNFNDTGAFIINKAALALMGIKDPIGKRVTWWNNTHVITGVVDNMVMGSPLEPITPTIFLLDPNWVSVTTVRLRGDRSLKESLAKVEAVFRKFSPSTPFQYSFVDEAYADKLKEEKRIGNLATLFAALAIFISCLGLYGLAAYVAERRIKEIGIRKVLGASVTSLWKLLSKEFVILVIISCAIAVPVAGYYLEAWLSGYSYRATISWWIYGSAVLGALTITLLTVSIQSIKAARSNPVKNLRAE